MKSVQYKDSMFISPNSTYSLECFWRFTLIKRKVCVDLKWWVWFLLCSDKGNWQRSARRRWAAPVRRWQWWWTRWIRVTLSRAPAVMKPFHSWTHTISMEDVSLLSDKLYIDPFCFTSLAVTVHDRKLCVVDSYNPSCPLTQHISRAPPTLNWPNQVMCLSASEDLN